MRASLLARSVATAALILVAVLAAAPTYGTSVLRRSVVDLIELSEDIVVGEVIEVRDGLDLGAVPYTAVTLRVDETLKGGASGTYTFRQFGLLEPRTMPDGTTNLMLSPDGWPRFKASESVVLFLYKPAQATGLRTTVGLMQGKFNIVDGQAVNAVANQGLFEGVRAAKSVLSAEEEKLLSARRGPLPAEAFIAFVRNTIQNRRIERGEVGHDAR